MDEPKKASGGDWILNVFALILGALAVGFIFIARILMHPGSHSSDFLLASLLAGTGVAPFLWFLLVVLMSSDPTRKGAALSAALLAVAATVIVTTLVDPITRRLPGTGVGIAFFFQFLFVMGVHMRWALQDRSKKPAKPLGRGV